MKPMTPLTLRDRARLHLYVQRYDFWLEAADVPRRRRRALRHELRANLDDAAHDVGTDAALAGLGAPRDLARDASVAVDRARPRWTSGLQWAVATFAVLLGLWTLSLLAFLDGVDAAGVSGPVSGTLFPWGSAVEAEAGSGLQVSATMPAAVWVLALLAFVAGSRPWLLLGRRPQDRTPARVDRAS